MDFRFTAEEEALRAEATEFVRQEWEHNDKDAYSMIVASYDVDDVDEEERMHAYAKKLAEKGWFTMHWPKEFGGWGAPLSTQLAYREAMAYAGSPEILGGGMFAPMLMMHGADWQRDFFLPRIASGEIHHLSQGFSEPNAGSDLANVQTRATWRTATISSSAARKFGTPKDDGRIGATTWFAQTPQRPSTAASPTSSSI